ncbi:MAG: PAS domain S-box protein [Desulfobacteraceae bacterium]|nr:MAG: PAS domain S-box protein [Desulfobacteraceae bacterium]
MEKTITILIIDDEPIVLESMADYLEDQGFQVLKADNGYTGLEILTSRHPDLVLTDLRMPGMDGLEVLKRAGKIMPGVPFIVVSGTGNIRDAIQAVRFGAWDYILKPVEDLSVISHAVEKAMERVRLLTENQVYQENLKALHIQEQQLRDLAEMLPEAVFETDPDFNLTFANRRAFDLFGYSREDFLRGLNGIHMLAPEERQRAREDFGKHLGSKDIEAFEYKGIRKDGSTFPMFFRVNAIMEKDRLTGYRGVIVDITERKRTEEILMKSEKKYRTIINESPIGIFYFDREGTILECNKKFVDIIGSSYELLIGLNMPKQLKDEKMIQAVRQTLCEGEAYYEGLYASVTSGKKTFVKIIFKGIRHEENEVTAGVGLVEDISERKLAEEEQQISEQRYRTLFDQSTDAIFLVDKHSGRYLDANRSAEKLTGRSLKELKQLTVHDVTPFGASGRLGLIAESVKAEKLGQVAYLRPDGERRIAALSSVPLDHDMVIGIARDITDELAMENQLRQAQKMEAIGTLAGGIAHDFNNILSAIIGYSELLLSDIAPGDPSRNKIMTIYRAGERARDLVSRILTFSRSEEPISSPVRMDQVIHESLNLLRPAIPSTITIRQNIETGSHVYGEPTRLQQIALNLCTNAYHAMEDTGGVLDISLVDEEISEQEAAVYRLAPGDYLKLSIADTGCGIPVEQMDRIFDPYFTTKEQGKGTGLGLSMVLGIVKSHGGAVSVESQVGRGTRFDVYLPKARYEDIPSAKVENLASGGRENILLVDDERDITDVQAEMLKRLGYQVTVTNKVEEAVDIFAANPKQFDLVISDMTMPNMTGIQLAEKLKTIKPEIPLIICSGYNEETSGKNLRGKPVDAFLQKPVAMGDLAKAVRKILDTKSISDSTKMDRE